MFRSASVHACIFAFIVSCQSKEKPAAEPEKANTDTTTAAASAAPPAASNDPKAPVAAQPNAQPAPPDVARPPVDAEKTSSGLATKVLTKGTGNEHPKSHDKGKVHYSGWTTDGKMFDSSVSRGEPTSFGVNQVIAGWTEALQLMVKGEKRRLWIPGKLAYGDSPPTGAPKGDLTFDVELLDITSMPAPPPVPKDVKEAPKNAKKTASGLAYLSLKKGSGKKPKASDRVRVHYTGWTTEGRVFDSSVARGQPAEFALDGVIKGWTEGVQLMKVGEKMRFWIPAKLAYGENPAHGAPAGMLVFDVELLAVL
jgi:FKBP-type peptidyl-prolyl cis-trans isomerase